MATSASGRRRLSVAGFRPKKEHREFREDDDKDDEHDGTGTEPPSSS